MDFFFIFPTNESSLLKKNPLKSLKSQTGKFTFCRLLFMVGKVQAPTDGVRSTTILLSLWRMQFSDLQAAESSCCWETPRFSDAGCGSDAPLPCQGLDFPWCPVHMEAIESAVPSIAAESSPASIQFQGPPRLTNVSVALTASEGLVVRVNEPVLIISGWLSFEGQNLGIRTDFLEWGELSGLVLWLFLIIARAICPHPCHHQVNPSSAPTPPSVKPF